MTDSVFTPYQKVALGVLAFLQFAVVLDFMIMSPMGALIMPGLSMTTEQFGLVVSGYAFSAGVSGLLTAGFADRFDRKKILLTVYAGFILGTLWCGLAQSFESLLFARIVTGLFGGVIGSTVLAIAGDLFPPQLRGRVMGLIQTAFAASQVLGIPAGLYLSNRWDWHMPFLAMAALSAVGGVAVAFLLKPVNAHLALPQEHSPFMHLLNTIREPRHWLAFATVGLLTTGGFMLMPFSSAYVVGDLGIDLAHLPTVYLITGVCTIVFGPMIGKAADAFGKLRVFTAGTLLTIVMILIYTHLGQVGLALVVLVNTVLMLGVFSRMIPFQALVQSVPAPQQRGAFNSISASIQQLSGGLASVVAGHLVSFTSTGMLVGFDRIGYVVTVTALGSLALAWQLVRELGRRAAVV